MQNQQSVEPETQTTSEKDQAQDEDKRVDPDDAIAKILNESVR